MRIIQNDVKSKICGLEGCVIAHNKKKYCSDTCSKEADKISRKRYERSDKGKQAVRKYRKTDKGKNFQLKAVERYQAKFPEKVRARSLSQNIETGKKCEAKGCNNKGEKHHPDYKKPLDVNYLCSKHHRRQHGKVIYNLN